MLMLISVAATRARALATAVSIIGEAFTVELQALRLAAIARFVFMLLDWGCHRIVFLLYLGKHLLCQHWFRDGGGVSALWLTWADVFVYFTVRASWLLSLSFAEEFVENLVLKLFIISRCVTNECRKAVWQRREVVIVSDLEVKVVHAIRSLEASEVRLRTVFKRSLWNWVLAENRRGVRVLLLVRCSATGGSR